MPKRYPAEFRRKVLDLVAAGRPVAQVASDLAISEQTIYVWRRQHLIDTGQLPGTTSSENAELMAARRRIAELEAEVAIHRRAARAARRGGVPKRRFEAIAVMASQSCRPSWPAGYSGSPSPATTTGAPRRRCRRGRCGTCG